MPRFLNMKFVIPCSLLAILMGPLSTIAATFDLSDDPPTRVVKFGDLDLTRSEGAAVLYSRISVAAREVCEPQLWELNMQALSYECQHRAIAKAVANVDSSTLTKYYESKTNFGTREGQLR
jgi:UrcA family protein